MNERPEPPPQGSESELLHTFLDYHRATLLQKTAGLGEDELRRPMTASGVTLLGIVKHLAYVERWWFRWVFAGEDVQFPWTDEDPNADWRIEPGETSADVFELYRAECERCRAATRGASPDAVSKREGKDMNLRWLLLHMIEETARHNGHADILRETIDGATGE